MFCGGGGVRPIILPLCALPPPPTADFSFRTARQPEEQSSAEDGLGREIPIEFLRFALPPKRSA